MHEQNKLVLLILVMLNALLNKDHRREREIRRERERDKERERDLGGGGHSGTERGRTWVTYFAEEGVFF